MAAMDNSSTSRDTVTVLVTGANSGIGFAICCRLIDEFLIARPPSHTLHLLFSTRDTKRGDDTRQRLEAHTRKSQGTNAAQALKSRLRLENVLVDLTRLTTVKTLADSLVARGIQLDAVIWNAGIAGWLGLNWPKAIWTVLTDIMHGITFPTYCIGNVGAVAGKQMANNKQETEEPQLGQVFLSNVFGHYMLTHWLSPLFTAHSRVVWVSSISAVRSTFALEDLQGLRTDVAYESSKRLTDLLVLTSDLPATKPYVKTFFPSAAHKPQMLVTHPGVAGTSIVALPLVLTWAMLAVSYIVRWMGSPWHVIVPYKAAVSAVFCALAPPSQLEDLEAREGKGKWGSVVNVFGDERVGRTEVDGWGYCGEPDVIPTGSVSGARGRYRYRQLNTAETRVTFEDEGRQVWKELEDLRVDWEKRLESQPKANGRL